MMLMRYLSSNTWEWRLILSRHGLEQNGRLVMLFTHARLELCENTKEDQHWAREVFESNSHHKSCVDSMI